MTIQSVELVWNAAERRFDEPGGLSERGRFLQLSHVPIKWLARASRLPGKALAVGLSIWSLALAVKKTTVMVTPSNVEPFGIDTSAKSRALTALANAGLISVDRRRGRFPIVTLMSVDQEDATTP